MATVDAPARRQDPAPTGPPPRTVLIIGGAVLLALVLFAVLGAVFWNLRGQHPAAQHPAVQHRVSGPVAGHHEETLDLLSGVTSVTVSGADLGSTLYQIETPNGSRLIPSATDTNGGVQVQLDGDGGNGSAVLVRLNRNVRWTVRFAAGSTSNTSDLRGIDLAAVEYIGGVSSIDLTLPKAGGTVLVRMNGGTSTFRIHAPDGVPVRVRAGGGAAGVTIDGEQHNGVAAGTAFSSAGWDSATDRYDVDNTAGVSSVVVDRS